MAKTSPIYIKVQTDVKEGAEAILKKTNTTLTEAIEIYLKQIILNGQIPFEIIQPQLNNNKLDNANQKESNSLDAFMEALLNREI